MILQGLKNRNTTSVFFILLTTVLRILVLSLLTRTMSEDIYGEFVLFLSVVMVISGISHFGMPNAILRWGSIYRHKKDLIATKRLLKIAFLLAGSFSALVLISIYLLRGYSDNIHSFNSIFLLTPLVIFNEIIASFFRSIEDTKQYFLIKDLIPSSIQLLAIGFLSIELFTYVVDVFIWSYILSSLYGVIFLVKNIKDKDYYIPSETFQELDRKWDYIKFGFAGALIGFLWTLKDRLIVLISGYYIGAAEAGIIFNASRLGITMTIVLSGVNILLAPQVAKLHHQDKISELQSIYRSYIKWVILAVFPMFVFMIIKPQLIMSIVFGQDSALAGDILFYFIIFKFLSLFFGSPGIVFQMTGMPRYEVVTTFAHVMIGTASIYFSFYEWGVLGGLIAIGIVGMLIEACRAWILQIKLKISSIRRLDLFVFILVILLILLLSHFLIIESILLTIFISLSATILLLALLTNDKEKGQIYNFIKEKK